MAKAKIDKENKKKNKLNTLLTNFKSMDNLSKSFIIGFVLSGVLLTGLTINYINVNQKAYLESIQYEDPSVNFVVVPPGTWTASIPSRTNVEKVVQDTTKGGRFDVTRYKLTDEIVPVVLVENAKSSEEQGVAGSSYISIALRGFDSSKDRLYDKKYCEEYLGALLEELDSENIKYTSTEELTKGYFNGTLVKAEAEDKGVKVYYAQYQEIVGNNVMTLTFGTTKRDLDGKEYIKDTLKYLRFKVLTDREYIDDVVVSQIKESSTDTDDTTTSSTTEKYNGYKKGN